MTLVRRILNLYSSAPRYFKHSIGTYIGPYIHTLFMYIQVIFFPRRSVKINRKKYVLYDKLYLCISTYSLKKISRLTNQLQLSSDCC